MSDSGSDHEVESVNMERALSVIMLSRRPLSATCPGYLMEFVNYLKVESLSARLEALLPGMEKVARYWQKNLEKISGSTPIAFMTRPSNPMASFLATSLDSTTMKKLKDFLKLFVASDITDEECLASLLTDYTAMSHTHANGATRAVDATGPIGLSARGFTEEIDMEDEDGYAQPERKWTSIAHSSTTVRKGDESRSCKLEVEPKRYQAVVTVYRTQDLLKLDLASQKWKETLMKMEMTYNPEDQVGIAMNALKEAHTRDLTRSGGKSVTKRIYRERRY